MAWPIFKTPSPETRNISFVSCFLGYFVILAVVPLISFLAMHLFLQLGKILDIELPDGVLQTILTFPFMTINMLSFSFMFSWAGVLLSIPVVVWARYYGYFGWGTAAICGVAVMFIAMPMLIGLDEFFGDESEINGLYLLLIAPSALLGISFWLTVFKLHRAEIYQQAPQNDASAP